MRQGDGRLDCPCRVADSFHTGWHSSLKFIKLSVCVCVCVSGCVCVTVCVCVCVFERKREREKAGIGLKEFAFPIRGGFGCVAVCRIGNLLVPNDNYCKCVCVCVCVRV